MAKTEGTYLKFLNSLEKVPLIVLDDFGLQTINKWILRSKFTTISAQSLPPLGGCCS